MTPSDDDQEDSKHLEPKKKKVIQPLDDAVGSSGIPKIDGASEDLLQELRKKTAELAESVDGRDSLPNRVLDLNETIALNNNSIEVKTATKKDDEKQNQESTPGKNAAAEMVRSKLAKIFKNEPDAAEEAIESYQAGSNRSIHQEFMYKLTTSGKSLADIQTEWHNYYKALPDDEKHNVWKEFYAMQDQTSSYARARKSTLEPTGITEQDKLQDKPKPIIKHKKRLPPDLRSVSDIKSQIMEKVSGGGKLKPIHHFKSLLFGLGIAGLVGLLVSFTFFNEVFIAPFISPSRTVSATPIIGDNTGPVGPEAKIIIPKINLEVPVVYDLGSIEEADIQNALEDGVVHYASTPNAGEKVNSVIVVHSSNNLLNSGKYKFAFVLLKRLEPEDTFFVQKGGVRYTYKIYKKEIVGPTETSVLDTQEKANTITLITCDPPGTSINRLIITAEQISPNPSGNKASTAPVLESNNVELPSNAPSLWSRLTSWI